MSQAVLELLNELISRPSLTPDDAGCQQLIADRLTKHGFVIRHLRFGDVDNLWATHGEGAPLVCLAGHTDVVPTGPVASWTSPPFEPEIREGFLYGRGASDMKASDAAMVIALERLAERGHPGTIALLLTSDEEGAGIDGTRHVLDRLIAEGVKIDAAIVGEPTSETAFGDVIKNGRRGSITGTITVKGVQGHTAYPQLAVNAVHRAAPALLELVDMDWGPGDDSFPPTTLQVSGVTAGTGASNVIPGDCTIQFNVRHGASITADQIRERIKDVFSLHGIFEPIDWAHSANPFVTSAGPLLEAVQSAVQEVTGVVPRRSTGGGTSDARFFADHRIPVVEFGPLNATIHAIDERIDVACLEPLAQVFEAACLKLLA
jgi:succinyl-diaminopimelate desuccinylase